MKWLEQNLRFAGYTARAGPATKANGERYGSASCHLAMALYDVFTDNASEGVDGAPLNDLRRLMGTIGHQSAAVARKQLQELVTAVPALLEAPLFAAPSGMHELPQILAAAWYARVKTEGFIPEYERFLQRMHWLLLTVQAEWASDQSRDVVDLDRVLEQIGDVQNTDELELRDSIKTRLHKTGRLLLPTPAAIVAAVGVTNETPVGAQDALVAFVRGVHEAFVKPGAGLTEAKADSPLQAQYLLHLNTFLADAAPQLATAVLPCDRTPIVAPWYASIVLATRTYAHALAIALAVPKVEDPTGVMFTLFSLETLAAEGVEEMLSPDVPEERRPLALRPMRALFSARSKSMYTCAPTQGGPWWVLLRATLSGLTTEQADDLAQKLLVVARTMPHVARNVAMLCVLMHTQTGMRVVGARTERGSRELANFPVAALIARVKDPSNGQTPLDVLMTTVSGTSDLPSLASDDLAFNANGQERQERAWVQELALRVEGVTAPRPPPRSTASAAKVEQTVGNFCDAMRAIGLDWLNDCLREQHEVAREGEGEEGEAMDADAPGEAVPLAIAVVDAEMLGTLCRVAQSHATLHCAPWLSAAFALACALEDFYQARDGGGLAEPPLIRSPQSAAIDAITAADVRKDEAWLRTHFCYLAEQALHSARVGGMWAAGAHLVLVAWVSTAPSAPNGPDLEADEDGVRLFARAITPHTVREVDNEAVDARLLTPNWRRSVEAHGWDSVVECAREFERALHARNVRALWLHDEAIERQRAIAADAEVAIEPPALEPPRMPAVPPSGLERYRAAAKATGPGRLDKGGVASLDEASDVALQRFRERVQETDAHDGILVCATGYAHGAAVAVVAVPSSEADLEHERKHRRSGKAPSKQAVERARLLSRLARFGSQ